MSTTKSYLYGKLRDSISQGLCLDAGSVSPSEARTLNNWKRSGVLVSPRPGLYAESTTWDGLDRRKRELTILRSESARNPSWVFCHASAAFAHGLFVSWRHLGRLHISQTRGQRGSSTPITQRHGRRAEGTVSIEGIRVTPLMETAADCMRCFDFTEGLAIADSAMALSHMGKADFVEAISSEAQGRRNGRKAIETSRYADSLSESGGESMARAVMIREGFLLPRLQVVVPNLLDPSHPYRVDFYWVLPDGRILVGEFDGYDKYRNANMTHRGDFEEALFRQRVRDSRISLKGATVMRFDFYDVTHPHRLVNILEKYGVPRVR